MFSYKIYNKCGCQKILCTVRAYMEQHARQQIEVGQCNKFEVQF